MFSGFSLKHHLKMTLIVLFPITMPSFTFSTPSTKVGTFPRLRSSAYSFLEDLSPTVRVITFKETGCSTIDNLSIIFTFYFTWFTAPSAWEDLDSGLPLWHACYIHWTHGDAGFHFMAVCNHYLPSQYHGVPSQILFHFLPRILHARTSNRPWKPGSVSISENEYSPTFMKVILSPIYFQKVLKSEIMSQEHFPCLCTKECDDGRASVPYCITPPQKLPTFWDLPVNYSITLVRLDLNFQ